MDADNTAHVGKGLERKPHFATGELLLTTIEKMTASASGKYERRDFVEPLIEFCSDGRYDGKVGIVYGLRSTGKKVGMLQAAEALTAQGQKVAYARFDYEEAGMKSVTDEIIRLAEEGVTHFFLDEASYLSDFVNLAPDWSDWLVPERAIKIIISGTDSFMLWTAQTTSLFHRFHRFSSNWNSFAEYKRVTGDSFEQYKREGGIFAIEDMPTYIQSAVVDNLLHTLDHCIDEANRKTIYTARLYGIDREVIYRVVISILKGVAEDSIAAHFMKNADKKNIADLGAVIAGLLPSEKRSIKERIADSLGVYRDFKAVTEPTEIVEALLEFLVHIDCLKKYKMGTREFFKPNSYTFTHNALMNFAVAETMEGILKLSGINQKSFVDSVTQAAEGAINESVVLAHLLNSSAKTKADEVFKYRDPQGREIDAVVVNRETKHAALLEVKSTTKIDGRTAFTDQARNMFDGDVLDNIGIDDSYAVLRAIVYAGANDIVQGDIDDVFLFNISDFCENIVDFKRFFREAIEDYDLRRTNREEKATDKDSVAQRRLSAGKPSGPVG
jgi:predicted AAA+ superfamily ATPase